MLHEIKTDMVKQMGDVRGGLDKRRDIRPAKEPSYWPVEEEDKSSISKPEAGLLASTTCGYLRR